MTDKIIRLGNIYGATGMSYAGNVFDSNGICQCLDSMTGGNRQPMILEVIPCAMRGRYTGKNGEVEQNLEIHDNGISNCLTGVNKDSLILEKYNDKQ